MTGSNSPVNLLSPSSSSRVPARVPSPPQVVHSTAKLGRYIGRVGALAATLGIGVMVVTSQGVASADSAGTSSGASSADSASATSAGESSTGSAATSTTGGSGSSTATATATGGGSTSTNGSTSTGTSTTSGATSSTSQV